MEDPVTNKLICRACLKILEKDKCSFGYVGEPRGKLRDMIMCVVPEMDIYVSPDPVICFTCIQALISLYNFKKKCIKTETSIRSYLRRHNLPQESEIDLTDLVRDIVRINKRLKNEQFRKQLGACLTPDNNEQMSKDSCSLPQIPQTDNRNDDNSTNVRTSDNTPTTIYQKNVSGRRNSSSISEFLLDSSPMNTPVRPCGSPVSILSNSTPLNITFPPHLSQNLNNLPPNRMNVASDTFQNHFRYRSPQNYTNNNILNYNNNNNHHRNFYQSNHMNFHSSDNYRTHVPNPLNVHNIPGPYHSNPARFPNNNNNILPFPQMYPTSDMSRSLIRNFPPLVPHGTPAPIYIVNRSFSNNPANYQHHPHQPHQQKRVPTTSHHISHNIDGILSSDYNKKHSNLEPFGGELRKSPADCMNGVRILDDRSANAINNIGSSSLQHLPNAAPYARFNFSRMPPAYNHAQTPAIFNHNHTPPLIFNRMPSSSSLPTYTSYTPRGYVPLPVRPLVPNLRPPLSLPAPLNRMPFYVQISLPNNNNNSVTTDKSQPSLPLVVRSTPNDEMTVPIVVKKEPADDVELQKDEAVEAAIVDSSAATCSDAVRMETVVEGSKIASKKRAASEESVQVHPIETKRRLVVLVEPCELLEQLIKKMQDDENIEDDKDGNGIPHQKVFQCISCMYLTTSSTFFAEHRKQCTKNVEEEPIEEDDATTYHIDPIEDVPHAFVLTNDYDAPYSVKEPFGGKLMPIEGQYTCDYCDYKTTEKGTYRRHVRTQHPNSVILGDVVCSLCNFRTLNKHHLKKHMIKHDPDYENMNRCPLCSYESKDRSNYRRHLFIHNPEMLECEFCDYKNASPYGIKNHLKKYHNGVGLEDVDCRTELPIEELLQEILNAIEKKNCSGHNL